MHRAARAAYRLGSRWVMASHRTAIIGSLSSQIAARSIIPITAASRSVWRSESARRYACTYLPNDPALIAQEQDPTTQRCGHAAERSHRTRSQNGWESSVSGKIVRDGGTVARCWPPPHGPLKVSSRRMGKTGICIDARHGETKNPT